MALLAGCEGDEGSPDSAPAKRAGPPPEEPNLIVVMTDDQTVGSFGPRAMPYTWKLFHDERSAIFEDALAVPPLCCPARAGFITGQYPHNHGVFTNNPGYSLLSDKNNVLPAWLQRAGYRTAMVGKFLNFYGYDEDLQLQPDAAEPAPGWDSWLAFLDEPGYYDYALGSDGEKVFHGTDRDEYSTDVLTARAVDQVADPERTDPLFMWLAYAAPHDDTSTISPCEGEFATPPTPEAFEEFAAAPLPRDPSFDEGDRSDKLRALADRPPITRETIDEMELRWRCGLAALRSADDGVRDVVEALEERGEMENTVLVFVSDNGFFFGEHALDKDKRLPYRAAAQIPMAIRVGAGVDDEAPPAEIDELAGTFDLAPTLLDYAGAEPCIGGDDCRTLDSVSLRPLLEGRDDDYPSDRAILLELDDGYTYEALRTTRYLYLRLEADHAGALPGGPGAELYDLSSDPYELENLLEVDPDGTAELRDELDARLDRLAACSGESCASG